MFLKSEMAYLISYSVCAPNTYYISESKQYLK